MSTATNTSWEPTLGQDYWVVDKNGDVTSLQFIGDTFDEECLEFGNCFETYEAARAARDQVSKLFSSLREAKQ